MPTIKIIGNRKEQLKAFSCIHRTGYSGFRGNVYNVRIEVIKKLEEKKVNFKYVELTKEQKKIMFMTGGTIR